MAFYGILPPEGNRVVRSAALAQAIRLKMVADLTFKVGDKVHVRTTPLDDLFHIVKFLNGEVSASGYHRGIKRFYVKFEDGSIHWVKPVYLYRGHR